MSRIKESCHVWVSHVTCEWVVSRVSESCHAWESHVTCYIWIEHVAYGLVISSTKESCHMWIISVKHKWLVNESRHVWEWVISHMWMSHVWHAAFILWLDSFMRDMTHFCSMTQSDLLHCHQTSKHAHLYTPTCQYIIPVPHISTYTHVFYRHTNTINITILRVSRKLITRNALAAHFNQTHMYTHI